MAGFRESVLAAQLGNGHAGFCFVQEADGLFFSSVNRFSMSNLRIWLIGL